MFSYFWKMALTLEVSISIIPRSDALLSQSHPPKFIMHSVINREDSHLKICFPFYQEFEER
jgi:hypothetical protein